MTWFKIDDGLYDHPKWIELPPAAQALWTNSGAWASKNLTDGWVSAAFVKRYAGGARAAGQLVSAGLWEQSEREDKKGWQFHDWLDYNPSGESVRASREANRNRQLIQRDPQLKDAVRARDGDQCRYCGLEVTWGDQRSPRGGTYDHVNPKGGTSYRNVVVSCRGCNSAKGHRTPAQARMTLRPESVRTESVSSTDARTQGVTARPPMDRVGYGSGRDGTGREPPPDDLDPPSWDPADYDLADLADLPDHRAGVPADPDRIAGQVS